MLQEDYATATYELIDGGMSVDSALKGLHKRLVAYGHSSLYPAILRSLQRLAEKRNVGDTPVVTVAKKEAYKSLLKEIKKALHTLDADTEPRVIEDENIVGGFIATYNGKIINKSYKQTLLNLYRNITA